MLIYGFWRLWVNINGGWSRLPMGLDMGLFSLCGCKGFGDLIVGSELEVYGWLQNLVFFFFFPVVMLNRSVFTLIPKLTHDNQNKIERTEK